MTKKQLKQRWRRFTNEELIGFLLSCKSPFEDLEGKMQDFRGFEQGSRMLKDLHMHEADFSYSNF